MESSLSFSAQIHIESHFSVILCPVFYLKNLFKLSFLGRSQMDLGYPFYSMLIVCSIYHCLPKQFLLGSQRYCLLLRHMYPDTLQGILVSAALLLGISLLSIMQVVDRVRASPARHYFSTFSNVKRINLFLEYLYHKPSERRLYETWRYFLNKYGHCICVVKVKTNWPISS